MCHGTKTAVKDANQTIRRGEEFKSYGRDNERGEADFMEADRMSASQTPAFFGSYLWTQLRGRLV